jgi:hypothetical protein
MFIKNSRVLINPNPHALEDTHKSQHRTRTSTTRSLARLIHDSHRERSDARTLFFLLYTLACTVIVGLSGFTHAS